MIRVTFFNERGKVVRVVASGHSGLAEHGNDVLCAAVSALVQTAYLAIRDVTEEITFDRNTQKGEFDFRIDADCENRHDVDVIIRALTVGLKDIASGYPHELKLEEKTQCL